MGFNFKRALRSATFMSIMEEENKKKETNPLESPSKFWLEREGLDFDELKEMEKKRRDKILKEHGLDPDEFFFD